MENKNEKFLIKCLFCGNDDQESFQTTMERDQGYSNYTVEDEGFIEIKRLTKGDFFTGCNGCKNKPDEDEHGEMVYELKLNAINVIFCETCLYDLEEIIISARIKKHVAISEVEDKE